MSDIFLSYASDDRERIKPIVTALEAEGWTVFWDRKTPVGMSWEEHIEQELNQSACVCVVWSEISMGKDWVRIEARQGLQRGCLMPLRIDAVDPPFGFDHKHYADLTGWSGDRQDHEWQGLAKGIERMVPRKIEKTEPVTIQPIKPPTTAQESTPAPKKADDTTKASGSALSKKQAAYLLSALGILVITLGILFGYQPDSHEQSNNDSQPSNESTASNPSPPKATAAPLPELVPIPAGCFTMGSDKYDSEKPPHKVCLDAFQMSRYEITFAQYDAFAKDKGLDLPND